MNKIWKLRCGEAIKFEFEFKKLEMNNIGKLRCGESIKFKFEFNGLETNMGDRGGGMGGMSLP